MAVHADAVPVSAGAELAVPETDPAGLPAWAAAMGDAVLVFDAGRRVSYANPAAERLLGAGAASLTHATLVDLVRRRVGALVADEARWLSLDGLVLQALRNGRAVSDDETTLTLPTGSAGVFSWRLDPIRGGREHAGAVTGAVLTIRDMTTLSKAAFQAAQTPQFQLRRDGVVSAVNWACRTVLGITGSGRVLCPLRDLVHADDVEGFDRLLGEFLDGRCDLLKTELRFVRPGGRAVWCQVTLTVPRRRILDGGDVFDRLVGVVEDISERKRLEDELRTRNAELEYLSKTDVLTGLHNRRYMEEQLERATSLLSRHGGELCALLLDIDHFKRVNDTYGHEAGDRVLRVLAGQLAANVRAEDVVSRWGGEEFLVLLPATRMDDATVLAERLRVLLAETPVELEDGTVLRPTTSIGVACGLEDGWDGLLRRADAALYTAKAGGRNRVVADTPTSPVTPYGG